MRIPIYQVDAFASERFRGNPAAICPVDEFLDDDLMQQIATENNLSETAFLVRNSSGYDLRWFTPAAEVDLCGHATLASAHVLLTELGEEPPIVFETRSGRLTVELRDELLQMDFPALPAGTVEPMPELERVMSLGSSETLCSVSGTVMLVLAAETDVRELRPNLAALEQMELDVIVTAAGDEYDCVSRYFAPQFGIPEDPVTGSIHCQLVPYWSERLGKTEIRAYQASERGGELVCELRDDRVLIAGRCSDYLRGEIEV